MKSTSLRAIAGLVGNGLRLAEVEEMTDAEIVAWSIVFGEAKGGKWNWLRMRWEDTD